MHGLEGEYWGQIDFVYIDREDGSNQNVVRQYDIRYQPVFVFVDPDGNEIQRWFRADQESFRQTFNDYLASAGG